MVQVEEVADEANVTQLSVRPGAPEVPPGGDFFRIPITMFSKGPTRSFRTCCSGSGTWRGW
jgi:hypothetical protein